MELVKFSDIFTYLKIESDKTLKTRLSSIESQSKKVDKIFGQNFFLLPKNFFDKKIFLTKKFFLTKNFFDRKFFWPKFFFSPKIFFD